MARALRTMAATRPWWSLEAACDLLLPCCCHSARNDRSESEARARVNAASATAAVLRRSPPGTASVAALATAAYPREVSRCDGHSSNDICPGAMELESPENELSASELSFARIELPAHDRSDVPL